MVLVSPTRATHFFFVCGSPPGAKKSKQKKAHPNVSALRYAPGDSLRSPFGPAYGCYSASLRFPRSGAVAGARHEGASCPSRLARRPASQPQPRHRNSASPTGAGASLMPGGSQVCSVENRAAFSTDGVTLPAWTRLRRCPPYRFAPKVSGAPNAPFRRANAGVVEWVEPHGCGERPNGPWTARVGRPRNGAGVSGPAAQRRAGCLGQAFLLTFAAIGKSESPGWAKQEPSAEHDNQLVP